MFVRVPIVPRLELRITLVKTWTGIEVKASFTSVFASPAGVPFVLGSFLYSLESSAALLPVVCNFGVNDRSAGAKDGSYLNFIIFAVGFHRG